MECEVKLRVIVVLKHGPTVKTNNRTKATTASGATAQSFVSQNNQNVRFIR